jgi:hypothetical protein
MTEQRIAKRILLVCKSKNCQEAKKAKVRCTISMPRSVTGMEAFTLNRRKFCTFYSTQMILETSNTPNWVVSPDKPGERNMREKAKVQADQAKKDDEDFYIENPEFLEVD